MEIGIVVGVGFIGKIVVMSKRPVRILPIARRIMGLVRFLGVSVMLDVVVRGTPIWTKKIIRRV